jgi:hypothetical protein
MVARSKAAKLAAKRGRGRPTLPPDMEARIADGRVNGRRSRRQSNQNARREQLEHEIISTVAATRIRHLGIVDAPDENGKLVKAETRAIDPRYGYLLGRLCMDHTITEEQYDAGNRYSEDMSRYYGLTGVPFPSAKAQNMFAIRSPDSGEPEGRGDAAKKARAKMIELRDVLLRVGDINTGRRVVHTVNEVCLVDSEHLRDLNSPMRAWLKAGLNALARFYGGGK